MYIHILYDLQGVLELSFKFTWVEVLYQVLKQRSQTEMETFSCPNAALQAVFFSCFHSQGALGVPPSRAAGWRCAGCKHWRIAGASPEVGMLQLTSPAVEQLGKR